MITPAENYLYRGNGFSWLKATKEYQKACKDWRVSKNLGNKIAQKNYMLNC